jgi:superfamily II DNA/RNA helicase
MPQTTENRGRMLSKLRIETLNPMQKEVYSSIHTVRDLVLLSPTGTGKTIAYLLPIIEKLDPKNTGTQVLILVPSRELAIQIEQVIREMGTGFKANAVYGGRAGYQDKLDLKQAPTLLVGTPGRLSDLMKREIFSTETIHTLILDEFDKSLEVGFEAEMKEIVAALPITVKKILTSATNEAKIPDFVGLKNPFCINYLHEKITQLKIKAIVSPSKDKLQTLVRTLYYLGNQPGIIFCNFKDSIQTVSDYLNKQQIHHGCFHGSMEQIDRERTLIKFRNGTYRLLLATDLAARGLDIPALQFIIHFELPPRSQEFTHRNGRTARMNSNGTAYVLREEKGNLPDFIGEIQTEIIKNSPAPKAPIWATLYITGGRRDKISKGDIAGLFMKQGKLEKDQLGVIEIKQDCSYVGVHASVAEKVIQAVNNERLKTKKVRVSEI